MADERDEDFSDDQGGSPITGQHSRDSRQSDGMSGQPIGGNDSATGTGTTLTQGADFSAQDRAGSIGNATQATDEGHFGQGTTSNAGGSTVGSDQTSGGSSGVSGGQGFVGSQREDSSEYLQQGRGALHEEEDGGSTGPRDDASA